MAIYSDPEALRQRQEDMRERMEARKAEARKLNKAIKLSCACTVSMKTDGVTRKQLSPVNATT